KTPTTMVSASEAATVSDSGVWPAAPLTAALERIAERCRVTLEPHQAWAAAAEGIAGGRGDPLRCFALAARRAGLLVARPRELELDQLSGPALAWLPGPGGGRWLLALGRRARRFELAVLDEYGERRWSASPAELAAWLYRETAGTIERLRWPEAEPWLPLATIQAPGGSPGPSPPGAVPRPRAPPPPPRAGLAVE